MSVIYRNYKQIGEDLLRWSSYLPSISAVCGVPRSGLHVAAMLAHHMHLPYIPIEALIQPDRLVYRPPVSRPLNRVDGPVLCLDDTSWTAKTMMRVREQVRHKRVIYGALYASDKSIGSGVIDVRGYKLPDIWHSFAHNLMRDRLGKSTLSDMDGVLCFDWGKPDSGSWLQPYLDFLQNAKPLHRCPRTIMGIVTSRLEKYRRLTEVWLRTHGYQYKHLIMAPYDTPEERKARDGFSGFKARTYLEMKDARLFVESCPRQAREIAETTKKPVLSYAEQKLYNGREPEPAW